jgi:uncharacterized RDD family membrane protein YckC
MVPYAGFWIRFVAYIIDAVILNIVAGVLGGLFGVGIGLSGLGAGATQGASFGIIGVTLIVNWVYYAGMESSAWQGTLGKKALSLVVTDEFGERIGFARASGRYFGKLLSSLIMGIGYIMVGVTDRKQGLHDKLAGTLVYKSNAPELLRNSAEVFS